MRFIATTLFFTLVYALAGHAIRLSTRRLGLTNVMGGALFGIGAYCAAAVARNTGSVSLGLMTAVIIGGVAGVIIFDIGGRMSGEDFSLGTFCLQVVFFQILNNWSSLTGGVFGLGGIPALGDGDVWVSYALSCAVCIGALWALNETMGPGGAPAFHAGVGVIARSVELAWSVGLSPRRIRTQLGFLAGAATGLAGGLLAGFLGFINPNIFGMPCSVTILGISMMFSGYALWKSLIGACFIVAVPEAVRILGLSAERSGYLQILVGGLVLLLSTVSGEESE
jgi:branched-chain amino acid transport system permease protein